MDNRINLSAYNEVEKAQAELPESGLRAYYREKMESARSDVAFIKEHVPMTGMRVCEIGCGNGKLLCALEKEGLIMHGGGMKYPPPAVRWQGSSAS